MGDRTVHARYPNMEIVRYDRAGKWYLEPTVPKAKRQAVSIDQAVAQTRWAREYYGNRAVVYLGLPGGGTFDRLVRNG